MSMLIETLDAALADAPQQPKAWVPLRRATVDQVRAIAAAVDAMICALQDSQPPADHTPAQEPVAVDVSVAVDEPKAPMAQTNGHRVTKPDARILFQAATAAKARVDQPRPATAVHIPWPPDKDELDVLLRKFDSGLLAFRRLTRDTRLQLITWRALAVMQERELTTGPTQGQWDYRRPAWMPAAAYLGQAFGPWNELQAAWERIAAGEDGE